MDFVKGMSVIQAAITYVSDLINAVGKIQNTKQKLASLEYREQLIKMKDSSY